MRILNFHEDSTSFFQELASAKRRVLVVDYDSVIASARNCQTTGIPCPTIAELLDCIMTTSRTRVVVIRGSRVADLPPHVPGPVPDFWGTDGCAAPDAMLPAMLSKLGDEAAVAFLSDRDRLFPALAETTGDVGGFYAAGRHDFVQFLVDWLRVCGGEIC
jgi:hypothetical protein